MDMFVLDGDVAQLETALRAQTGSARLPNLVALAWHLRQRDTRRALDLLQEAETLLPASSLAETERLRIHARIALIRAEAKWLFALLDEASQLADSALKLFDRAHDRNGACDVHFLRAFIASDLGQFQVGDEELKMAAFEARRANNRMRAEVVDATLALWMAFGETHTAQAHLDNIIYAGDHPLHPAVATWTNDYLGLVTTMAGDFAVGATHIIHMHEAALETGQIRRAILAAANAGEVFRNLNDHQAGLEWMQRGLDLARKTGWPASIGICLIETGEAQRHLQRYDAAHDLLHEALSTLAPLAGSRNYALALQYLGDLELDRNKHEAALDIFQRLENCPASAHHCDLRIGARRGQAHALMHLGQATRAHEHALAALKLARSKKLPDMEIDVLKVLADLHSHFDLPNPPDLGAPNATLHYLQLAQDVGAAIDGYVVPGALLDRVAHEYARAGNFPQAYEVAQKASIARQQSNRRDATNRAIAMQVQYQTERAQTEAQHHKQLAAAEAHRAEALQRTSTTLDLLSVIGQEITAHLNADAVYQILDRHVHGLLDATSFAIYVCNADRSSLTSAFRVEQGKALPTRVVDMNDPNSNAARAARERREILNIVEDFGKVGSYIPGTLQNRSALFMPLVVGERLIGVMTVQSLSATAYGERERLIFRTLCAYGAIALDNANAYRQLEATLKTLRATQDELLHKNIELERAYREQQQASLTDALTGLRNRRFLLEHVEGDAASTLRRYEKQIAGPSENTGDLDLVFFIIDLDHFKAINDQFGHAAGDMALIQMRERLLQASRETDHLIRWGGEEFLIVARSTNREEACTIADRIRDAVATDDFDLGNGVRTRLSCSVGFAAYPFVVSDPDALTWSQVLELADRGLYVAKNSGRNRWTGVYAQDGVDYRAQYQNVVHDISAADEAGRLRLVQSVQRALL